MQFAKEHIKVAISVNDWGKKAKNERRNQSNFNMFPNGFVYSGKEGDKFLSSTPFVGKMKEAAEEADDNCDNDNF